MFDTEKILSVILTTNEYNIVGVKTEVINTEFLNVDKRDLMSHFVYTVR